MWGFTIDDAFIPIRYARNILAGHGWRFDANGPPSDGVTPLPWPIVILPLAFGNEPLAILDRIRVFGVLVHLGSIGVLGWRIGGIDAARWVKGVALVALALCLPVAAHASSGMETALAMALATTAFAFFDRPAVAAWLAGACAALRPEMIVWAAALASGLAIAARAKVAWCVVRAVLPAIAVAIVRVACFGRPAPLAVLAKPADLGQGFMYAAAAIVACAIPVLVFAPLALRKERGPALAIAIAAVLHTIAVIAAGGDWMPYARLFAPIASGFAVAFVLLHAHVASIAVRGAIAIAGSVAMWIVAAPRGRGVLRDRTALVLEARPLLRDAKKVAAVDIGWVSAATDGPILDLAGLTDPQIALLPGSHTSKRVDAAMLLDRGADALLVYVPAETDPENWREAPYTRVVEARLVDSPAIRERFGNPRLLKVSEANGYILLRATR
jgi:hypothetical protein